MDCSVAWLPAMTTACHSGPCQSGASTVRNGALGNDTKKKRDGIAPVAFQLLQLAGPGAESTLCQAKAKLSGRSQRGDSAW